MLFMWLLVFQRLTLEFFLDFLYFPIWWFTAGAVRAAGWCWNLFLEGNFILAPGLWFKNLLVPMFGQNDLQGRLVSLFMRLLNVIFRFFCLLIWLIITFLIFLLWFAVPLVLVFMLYQSLI